MGKSEYRDFEEFREAANENAENEDLKRMLGVDGKRVTDISEVIAKAVDAGVVEFETGKINDTVSLREVLSRKLKQAIQKHEAENGDQSMIDRITNGIYDPEDVTRYIEKQYGYLMHEPQGRKRVYEIFREAVEYFNEHVAPHGKGTHKIHKNLLEELGYDSQNKISTPPEGINRIFATAAGHGRKALTPQACALLRIAYVISYVDRDPRIGLMTHADAALTKKIKTLKEDSFYDNLIRGMASRTKEKSRIITKLLHKSKNQAEQVLDHVGLRFIVESPADTLRLIRALFLDKKHAVFPETTVKIAMTKTLLLRKITGELSAAEFRKYISNAIDNPDKADEFFALFSEEIDVEEGEFVDDDENAHSAAKYRAIKIIFELPVIDDSGKRHYFPVEVQVLDQNSKQVNNKSASHEDYKKRQEQTVHNRITGNNLLSEWNVAKISHNKRKNKKKFRKKRSLTK